MVQNHERMLRAGIAFLIIPFIVFAALNPILWEDLSWTGPIPVVLDIPEPHPFPVPVRILEQPSSGTYFGVWLCTPIAEPWYYVFGVTDDPARWPRLINLADVFAEVPADHIIGADLGLLANGSLLLIAQWRQDRGNSSSPIVIGFSVSSDAGLSWTPSSNVSLPYTAGTALFMQHLGVYEQDNSVRVCGYLYGETTEYDEDAPVAVVLWTLDANLTSVTHTLQYAPDPFAWSVSPALLVEEHLAMVLLVFQNNSAQLVSTNGTVWEPWNILPFIGSYGDLFESRQQLYMVHRNDGGYAAWLSPPGLYCSRIATNPANKTWTCLETRRITGHLPIAISTIQTASIPMFCCYDWGVDFAHLYVLTFTPVPVLVLIVLVALMLTVIFVPSNLIRRIGRGLKRS